MNDTFSPVAYMLTHSSLACMQEIQDLQSVAVPEHIATNRTASAARAARYPVTLSTYSLQLLMAFLQGAKLWLLLGIVNQHLKVQVHCVWAPLLLASSLNVCSKQTGGNLHVSSAKPGL